VRNICWQWLERTALLLQPHECEAVLGDLAETGESAWQGFLGVLGLVVRRRLMPGKAWRPRLASLGLAFPATMLLLGFSLTVSQTYQRLIATTFRTSGLTVGLGLLMLFCNVLLLMGWCWTGGFVVGSFPRRIARVSMVLSFLPCLFCLAWLHVESLSRFCLLLFLLPAIWGVVRGFEVAQIRPGAALILALAVTLLTIPTWSTTGAWIPNWALSWPAWYLVATAWRRPTAKGMSHWQTV
jgi:hypothetical protein